MCSHNFAPASCNDPAPPGTVVCGPAHPLRAGVAVRLVGPHSHPAAAMISQLEGLTGLAMNGKPIMRTGDNSPELSGYELLAWEMLRQAAADLGTFVRYGLITPQGQCRPWPFVMQRRMKRSKKNGWQYFNYRQRANICCSQGPHEHRQLVAWFLSEDAQTLCDLVGFNLDPQEIFTRTIKNHAGGKL